jgi:hypothetical protein
MCRQIYTYPAFRCGCLKNPNNPTISWDCSHNNGKYCGNTVTESNKVLDRVKSCKGKKCKAEGARPKKEKSKKGKRKKVKREKVNHE